MKMNYFKIWGLVLFTVLCINTESMATDCTPTPDCATLGYTKTESECTGANLVLKCPFDDSKVACSAVTYVPKAGDILYSDRSVSPWREYYKYVAAGKTPIGIVFDASNRLAVALDQTSLYWSTEKIDIPTLGNCDKSSSCFTNGKQNTAAIMEYVKTNGKTGKYPAAEYCASYKPSTGYQDEVWYAEGQWFLPSIKELQTLHNNMGDVNVALRKVNAGTLSIGYHWSSSEYAGNAAWDLFMGSGDLYYNDKGNYNYYVRPVLAF